MSQTQRVVSQNLLALKAIRRKSDREIGAGMGRPRTWVNDRISGVRECKVSELAEFAAYFEVPIGQLFDDPYAVAVSAVDQGLRLVPENPGTLRTFRWMYANQWEIPDPAGLRGTRPSGWMYVTPGPGKTVIRVDLVARRRLKPAA